MIIDERTLFADNLDVSSTAGTALEGNQIDLVNARDIGKGTPLYLVIVVEEDFDSAGSATVEFQLASDASAAVATDGTASVHVKTGVIPFAQLTAGKVFGIALPMEGVVYERFLGLRVVTAGATTSAGSITAFLTPEVGKWHPFVEASS